MFADISNVSKYRNAYKLLSFDDDLMPFGQANEEDVEKAHEVLLKLSSLVNKRVAIEKMRTKDKGPETEGKCFKVLDQVGLGFDLILFFTFLHQF